MLLQRGLPIATLTRHHLRRRRSGACLPWNTLLELPSLHSFGDSLDGPKFLGLCVVSNRSRTASTWPNPSIPRLAHVRCFPQTSVSNLTRQERAPCAAAFVGYGASRLLSSSALQTASLQQSQHSQRRHRGLRLGMFSKNSLMDSGVKSCTIACAMSLVLPTSTHSCFQNSHSVDPSAGLSCCGHLSHT
jgi:hypothetical protein